MLVAAQNHAITPALYADRINFDAVKSFTPICIVAESPEVLVVTPKMGVRSLSDFMKKVGEKPGEYTYASVGTGSAVHLSTAEFLQMQKLSMNQIPYKGSAPASTAILAGEVDSYLASIGTVLPYITAGKLIPLAVATQERSRLLPQVPTFAEQGVPGFDAAVWYAFLAPAGTPPDIVEKLEREARSFGGDAAVQQRLIGAGVEPQLTCGGAFSAQVAKEVEANKRLVKSLSLKVD